MTQSLTWLLFILPMWSRGDLRWLHDRCNFFCLSQHGISTINSPCTFFISPLKYLNTAVSFLIFDIGLLCCVFLNKKSCFFSRQIQSPQFAPHGCSLLHLIPLCMFIVTWSFSSPQSLFQLASYNLQNSIQLFRYQPVLIKWKNIFSTVVH